MFKFKVSYVALAAALSSSVVYADPSSYTHRSGANVIDIEAPNAAGVSHNLYREFNVGPNGTILNNSASDVNHSTHGNIAKNNNLTNGSASVILNEVTSNKMSNLQGFIEVNGQKADVVIANPNGITCSGCSFINTNKAVLTTGQVNLSDTGAIDSYTVTQGKITIDDKGMNASNSYAALLADAIAINGTMTAANAMVGAGNLTFDNKTGKMTSLGKAATAKQILYPEYSIDISQLGGIKANSITMTGNNLGFGVRNKGTMAANTLLTMTSNGSLINEGAITGKGIATQIVSAGEMKNKGSINSSALATQVTTLNTLTNEGTITSDKTLNVSAAGNLVNTGRINGTKALTLTTLGDINTTYGSTINADGQLNISAHNINNGGTMWGEITNVKFSGDNLTVTGNLWGYTNLAIVSAKDSNVSSGNIHNTGRISGIDISLITNGDIIQDGNLVSGNSMTVKSVQFKNNNYVYGKSVQIESNNVHNKATIDSVDANIIAYYGMKNEGQIIAAKDLTLDTKNFADITNYGTLQAGENLTIIANKVYNGGYRCGFLKLSTCNVGSISTNKLVLNSAHNYVSEMGGHQQFKQPEITTKR